LFKLVQASILRFYTALFLAQGIDYLLHSLTFPVIHKLLLVIAVLI